jgi:hypothetical protein
MGRDKAVVAASAPIIASQMKWPAGKQKALRDAVPD